MDADGYLLSKAYLLNLRGSDIPHNPLFHAFLWVGLENATIFLDASKVNEETSTYLKSLGVERREYTDLWTFLRRREWGEGKVRALVTNGLSYINRISPGSDIPSNVLCHFIDAHPLPLHRRTILGREHDGSQE